MRGCLDFDSRKKNVVNISTDGKDIARGPFELPIVV
jgi:hypothetical protein